MSQKLRYPQTLHDMVFNPKPKQTKEMDQRGTTWRKAKNDKGQEQWVEVCDFCGANCGQCGMTARLGNFSGPGSQIMDQLVEQVR